jgi:hypothetical protein
MLVAFFQGRGGEHLEDTGDCGAPRAVVRPEIDERTRPRARLLDPDGTCAYDALRRVARIVRVGRDGHGEAGEAAGPELRHLDPDGARPRARAKNAVSQTRPARAP